MSGTATGVRSRYNVAINGRGYMLRGVPGVASYSKERAPSLVSQLGVGDLNYNSLNGSGWSFWTQTDWSGGFQTLKFKDNASFKDGQAVDVIRKYGQVSLQYGWVSAATTKISGGYSSHGIHGTDLLFGTVRNAGARIYKVTSAFSVSSLSAMTTISAVNTITRFGNDSIIGMTKQTAASASVKSMAKYTGSSVSGFRAANPVVRSVKGIGIRLYSGERVRSLSGDVLYYATNLSAFTSAYQAGKNRNIQKIEDLNGVPYFFIVEGRRVELFSWDEVANRAYPIYTWQDLTSFSVKNYLTLLIISGKSGGKNSVFAFNGSRIWEVFDDQLMDTSYDFRYPYEFEGNYHNYGAQWDGSIWAPGVYGKVGSSRVVPFENFSNKIVGVITGGTVQRICYQDRTKYATSGHYIGSEFGSNIAGVDKLVNAADINMEALATGQTIDVQYSVDGGASFTSLGKAQYSVGGALKKKRLYFPSGYVTKNWLPKVVLVGPGTSTPTVTDVTFEYRPITDLKRRWTLGINATADIQLLNQQREERSPTEVMQNLWNEMISKRTVVFEDQDAFQTRITSAMTSANTSANIESSRLMPRQGRIRVLKAGVVEEMTYTSADGGKIQGLTRGINGTQVRAYTSADYMDNFYQVIITDVAERVVTTDEQKSESVAQVTLLEV